MNLSIVATVSLAIATAMNYQNKGVRNVAQSMEFQTLVQQLTLVTSSEKICAGSPFRGPGNTGQPPIHLTWVPSVSQPLDVPMIQLGTGSPSSPRRTIAATGTVSQGVRINSMRLSMPSPDADHGISTYANGQRRFVEANLVIDAEKVSAPGAAGLGNSRLNKTIPLAIFIDPSNNQIMECHSGGVQALVEACATTGGAWITSGGGLGYCHYSRFDVVSAATDVRPTGATGFFTNQNMTIKGGMVLSKQNEPLQPAGVIPDGGLFASGDIITAKALGTYAGLALNNSNRTGDPSNKHWMEIKQYSNDLPTELFFNGHFDARDAGDPPSYHREILRLTSHAMQSGESPQVYISAIPGVQSGPPRPNGIEFGSYNSGAAQVSFWNRGSGQFLSAEMKDLKLNGTIVNPADPVAPGSGKVLGTADSNGLAKWMKPVAVAWRSTSPMILSFRNGIGSPTQPVQSRQDMLNQIASYPGSFPIVAMPGPVPGSGCLPLGVGQAANAPSTYCEMRVGLSNQNMMIAKSITGLVGPAPAFSDPDECHPVYVGTSVDQQIRLHDLAGAGDRYMSGGSDFPNDEVGTGQAAGGCNVAWDSTNGWAVHIYRHRYGSVNCAVQCTKMMMLDSSGTLH